jgi:TolB-like protein
VSDQPLVEAEADKAKDADEKKKRKKDKVRSAWISFVGRILAQLVGAIATVALGVMVLHTYASPDGPEPLREDARPAPQVVPASNPRPDGEISLAVLPFENFSAAIEHEYFADGMTEALITSLSKVASLRVMSRTSAMQFKGQRKSLREIAQQLGAKWIVEGSIALDGKRVRITGQLIDADTDQHFWAESYDRSVKDVLELQAEVAEVISRAIAAALQSE